MKVIKLVDKNTVELKFSRSSFCNHCVSKSSCNLLESSKNLVVKALNPRGLALKVGDTVVVEHKDFSVSKLSFLVYGIPLIVFISFLTLFTILLKSELYGFIGGIIALIISFFALKIYDKKFGKRYKPVIIEKYDGNSVNFGENFYSEYE